VACGIRLVASSDHPSRGVAAPCRVFNLVSLAPSWVRRSPLALCLTWPGLRVFTLQVPGKTSDEFPGSSHGLRLLFRGWPSTCRCLKLLVSQKPASLGRNQKTARSASLEVSSPSAPSRPEQRHEWPDLPHPTVCAFRCSQPHGAFIRPEPAGLVSCRIRSWENPSELSSSCAAVRCFQRHSPLGVPKRLQGFAPR